MTRPAFPFRDRDVTADELLAMGGDYAAIAPIVATNPLHAHSRVWGIWCREHGDYLLSVDGVSTPQALDTPCPDCGQDRWLVIPMPDDEEWSAHEYCQCCGFMSPVWRQD